MSHARKALLTLSAAAVAIATAATGLAQTSAEDANKSNNPLSIAPGLNFQDYYTPKLYDSDAFTNDLLLRGALPLPPTGFVPVPQLLRLTVPGSTQAERIVITE